MNIGLVIYGSLDTLSGGYLYDRKMVEYLRKKGDSIEIFSLPWRNYVSHLTDNLRFRLPRQLDILIQDELNHPSLIRANRQQHPYPVISLVHHLRCSEQRPVWQNAFYELVEKTYLNSVDGFIFNSQTTETMVQGLLEHKQPAVIAYPPTDQFGSPLSEGQIIDRAHSHPLRILFLGNVIERKGLHTLLGAIRHRSLECKVDVVGSLHADPKYAYEMQRYVLTHRLSSRVTFHSALDKKELINKLKQAHLLVVPSSYEGFGIVYLEGMGFGLPAIGTTVGAAGEVIEAGETGYLIEPDDSQALADYIHLLAEDRDVLRRLSLNALARFHRQPSWENSAESIRNFLCSFVQ